MGNFLLLVLAFFAAVFALLAGGTAVATYLLAGEVRLFLRAPAFYIKKLTSGPSAPQQAKRITQRIHKLLPQGSSYARDLRDRVQSVIPTIESLVRQQDRITLYLEYDVYGDDLGDTARRQDPEALRSLEKRRQELTDKIEAALTDLKRIEGRVAAHVLAAQDSFEEESMQAELSDTLEELEVLIEGDRSAGLLPR
jgi:hypothetical protein